MSSTKADALWEAMPADGSSISNIRLREKLGWEKDEYDELTAALVKSGRAIRGSGRGGTLRRGPAEGTTPAESPDEVKPVRERKPKISGDTAAPPAPAPARRPTAPPPPPVGARAADAEDLPPPAMQGPLEEFAWQLYQDIEGRRLTDQLSISEALMEHAIDKLENDDFDDLRGHSFVDIDPYTNDVRLRFDGYDLRGIDDDERTRIDLFVVHATNPVVTEPDGTRRVRVPQLDEPTANELLRAARRFVEKSFEGLADEINDDPEARDVARTIRKSKQLTKVEICLVTNAELRGFDRSEEVVGGVTIIKRALDFKALRLRSEPSTIEVDFSVAQPGGLPCVALPSPNESYRAFLAIVPGSFLCALYEKYKQRLLEANVRSYLRATNKSVNNGIIDTARKQPEMFFAYNNGITVTAEDLVVDTRPDGSAVLVRCKNLQIVNGGQTTASLYRAKEKDKKLDLSKVFVPMKINCPLSKESANDLVQKISRFANSQNKVNLSDFGANQPFHVALQELARNELPPTGAGRWYYERMRAEYENDVRMAGTPARQRDFQKLFPKKQVIKKPDVARYFMIWDEKPNLVCYGAEKNYQSFRQQVIEGRSRKSDASTGEDDDQKQRDFLPDAAWFHALIAKALITRRCGELIDAQKIPGYRANIVAYTVALLSHERGKQTDLEAIWREQAVDPATERWMHDAIDIVRAHITTPPKEGQNVGEWTKKPACWQSLVEAWSKRS